jgi:parallel beta-helix repeat protein
MEKPSSFHKMLPEFNRESILPEHSESFTLASSLIPHDPIYIDGKRDFKKQAKDEGWPGKGSKDKPFIIENYYIDGNGADISCIEIRNNEKMYFIIRNCVIEGATAPYFYMVYDDDILVDFFNVRAGIYLYNVNEAVLTGNLCYNNRFGVVVNESESVLLSENTCENNIASGLLLQRSSHNTIENNVCPGNGFDGIVLMDGSIDNEVVSNECMLNGGNGITIGWGLGCDDNTLMENVCSYNTYSGVVLGFFPFGSYSVNNHLVDNIFEGNIFGVSLGVFSMYTTIINNLCEYNYYGIAAYRSSNNEIIENECYSNVCGIIVESSNENTLTGNICSNNDPFGIWLYESHDNIVQGNAASGERDGNYFNVDTGILLFASQDNLIEDNEIFVTHNGIFLQYSDDNTLTANTVTGVWHGYRLAISSWNSLEANVANDIDGMGFWLYEDSNHNELYINTATDCTHGFRLGFSYVTDWTNYIVSHEPVEENILVGNTATGCFWTGFLVDASSGNIFEDNTAVENLAGFRIAWGSADNIIIGNTITSITGQDAGIRIWGSDNIVTENTITGNHWWGIIIQYDPGWGITSMGNLIYHNNLIDNIHQARDLYPENNYWYHPDLLEGNYWSDYTGVDDGSGGRIAGDGIGDTDIPWHYDWYPFINQDGWIISP